MVGFVLSWEWMVAVKLSESKDTRNKGTERCDTPSLLLLLPNQNGDQTPNEV